MIARALVFDFDGTIIDTETPVYESWRATFEWAGVEPIGLEAWQAQIGLADADSIDLRAVLCEQLGVDEVPPDLEDYRRRRRDELLHALPIRDGIIEWLERALDAGVELAVASSSGTGWVDGNLRRIGLRHHFEVLSCADPGVPGKPDPHVYREACRRIGVETVEAIAIEDSPNGVRAAVAAGMRCIAAPGPITAGADFSHATLAVASLAELDPADWL